MTIRRSMLLVGAGGLAVTALVVRVAVAEAPVSLTVAHGSGECTFDWTKEGVAFTPTAPGKAPGSYAVSDIKGTVTVDMAAPDPLSFARSATVDGRFKGGFTLKDAAGHFVQVSEGQGSAPAGKGEFLVKTSADGAGTRMPVYALKDASDALDPSIVSMVPPRVKLNVLPIEMVLTPEFARTLNDTFGPDSANPGQPYGICSAQITTS
ncbi:hypothetical protein ACFXDE_17565 [Kitasatospora sp. NPDC059408]|uniref:hypothetical protein n=1 Tax=Kitasatospora sp. NPDC059408 TaxID=3346823 RepID=UPI00368B9F61